jgi:hypothetical protein
MDPAERGLQPFRPIKPDTDNTGGGRIQGYLGFDAKNPLFRPGNRGFIIFLARIRRSGCAAADYCQMRRRAPGENGKPGETAAAGRRG